MDTKERQIPTNAKFVVYLYPGSNSTLQKTLLTQDDTPHINKVDMDRESIRHSEGGHAYGVKFKDINHKELPYTYIIRAEGTVKDLMDLLNEEYKVENDLEQAYASEVLKNKHFSTYIKVKISDNLRFFPFDPQTMIVVPSDK